MTTPAALIHADCVLHPGKGCLLDAGNLHNILNCRKRSVFLPVRCNCGRSGLTDAGDLLQLLLIRAVDIDLSGGSAPGLITVPAGGNTALPGSSRTGRR